MATLTDFSKHVVAQLTPTCTGNERPVAALQEHNADAALLHALHAVDIKPQLETKTYVLPVFWINSSASPPQLTVRSVIPLGYKNSSIAVAKSGQIVQVDNVSRVVSFYNLNDGKIYHKSVGEGFCFTKVAVDMDGRIWLSGSSSHEILCIDEEGRLLGVKKFSENTHINFFAFLGAQLVVVEYSVNYRTHPFVDDHISIYTTLFVEEEPMKVIHIGSADVNDLKICDRTGVIFFVQGYKLRAITPDGNAHDVNLNDTKLLVGIKSIALTVNGELLACDIGNNSILRYIPVVDDKRSLYVSPHSPHF